MAPTPCFHCGLPNSPNSAWTLEIEGRVERFCCPGCRAVCEVIHSSGLGDYYRYRDQPAPSAQSAEAASREALRVYDDPTIQRSFVRGLGTEREASLILEGIRCPACLWLNEHHLRRTAGITAVEIDYNSERAWVRWDPEQIPLSEILAAIEAIGYRAHPYDPVHREQLTQLQRQRNSNRLLFAGLLGMAVMEVALATYIMGGPNPDGTLPLWVTLGRWTSLIAAAAILIFPGQEFYRGAWNDLRHGRLGMDVPIVLGLSLAFGGSVWATMTQSGEVYYDSIGMFVFFVLVARRFELSGRLRAARFVDELARITPRRARRVDDDGTHTEVPVFQLEPGERIVLRPGEGIPVDGWIVAGRGPLDEAVLTGEARPRERGIGEPVYSGSVNLEQPLTVEVTHRSQDSTVAQLQARLEEALRSRPRSALLAEQAAHWFIPIVLMLAAGTAFGWWPVDPALALEHTIAVLIVTCPCALALAAPVAVSVAAGRLAELGVLPLRLEALEALAKADVFAFDKTGTLTHGDLRIVATRTRSGVDAAEASRLAAALEGPSEHVIARAFRGVTRGADGDPPETPPVTDWRNHPSEGVSGVIEGHPYRLGRAEFVASAGEVLPDGLSQPSAWAGQEASVLYLARDGVVIAAFALDDRVRDAALTLGPALRATGINDWAILSGDSPARVEALGERLGADTVLGGVRTEDKRGWIQQRQAEGRRVVMVGDGLNDAASLGAADASVAVAEATELAQLGSDFVLLQSDLTVLVEARQLARRMRRIIRQNFAWAVGYNLVAVPFAIAGLIPPWGAALGMSASSLVVVFNALRVRRLGRAAAGGRARAARGGPALAGAAHQPSRA